jgi:hypothetical protein
MASSPFPLTCFFPPRPCFIHFRFSSCQVDLEADDIVSETLAGIGIDVAAMMSEAPTKAPVGRPAAVAAAAEEAPAQEADPFADLDARFAALS